MARPITDRDVTEQAAHLADGGWFYTPRQLYYAVSASVETPFTSTARGELGCGVTLLMLAIIAVGTSHVATVVLGTLGAGLVASGIRSRRGDRVRAMLPAGRSFGVSAAEFDARWVEPRRLPGAEHLEGLLIDPGNLEAQPLTAADLAGDVIVCDHRETATLLRANAGRGAMGLPVTDEAALPAGARPARVFTVHDADPHGCGLPLRMAGCTGDVVDVGIRPGHVNADVAQVIEGAPALLSAELASFLGPEDGGWLAHGFRAELAMLPPDTLVPALARAIASDPLPVSGSRAAPSSGVRTARFVAHSRAPSRPGVPVPPAPPAA